MTPSELRAGRDALGLSQSALAAVIGATPKSVQNWEQGVSAVPGPVARIMGWLAAGYRPPEWPR